MKYDLYIVCGTAGIEVWPISDNGVEAIEKYVPEWEVGCKIILNMHPEEFQALFPPPLQFLAQNPDNGKVGPFTRKPLQ